MNLYALIAIGKCVGYIWMYWACPFHLLACFAELQNRLTDQMDMPSTCIHTQCICQLQRAKNSRKWQNVKQLSPWRGSEAVAPLVSPRMLGPAAVCCGGQGWFLTGGMGKLCKNKTGWLRRNDENYSVSYWVIGCTGRCNGRGHDVYTPLHPPLK